MSTVTVRFVDDQLWAEFKAEAAYARSTVGELLNIALNHWFECGNPPAVPPPTAEDVRLPLRRG